MRRNRAKECKRPVVLFEEQRAALAIELVRAQGRRVRTVARDKGVLIRTAVFAILHHPELAC